MLQKLLPLAFGWIEAVPSYMPPPPGSKLRVFFDECEKGVGAELELLTVLSGFYLFIYLYCSHTCLNIFSLLLLHTFFKGHNPPAFPALGINKNRLKLMGPRLKGI